MSSHQGGTGLQSTNGMCGMILNPDKMQAKRINKLRVALELELAENIYSRFIKKGKTLKDKS